MSLQQRREVLAAARRHKVLDGLEGDVVARHQPRALQRPHLATLELENVKVSQPQQGQGQVNRPQVPPPA